MAQPSLVKLPPRGELGLASLGALGPSPYCACKRRNGRAPAASVAAAAAAGEGKGRGGRGAAWIYCCKGTGGCAGQIHPSCFGLDGATAEVWAGVDRRRDFVCPLCSGDGWVVDPSCELRKRAVSYPTGTTFRILVDHKGVRLGWFKAEVVRADSAPSPLPGEALGFSSTEVLLPPLSTRYTLRFVYNGAEVSLRLGERDATIVLDKDFERCPGYREQDISYRLQAAGRAARA